MTTPADIRRADERRKVIESCFVVIWEDRHSDTTAHIFTCPEKAIDWAMAKARQYGNQHGELDEMVTDAMRDGGCLYYGCYSCEGDHLRVVECVLDSTE